MGDTTRRSQWDCVRWAERQTCGGPGPKSVLMALANFAGLVGDEWSCYPSQETLSEITEQSDRTVRRHLTDLESKGILSRQRRADRAGHRTSDRYILPVYLPDNMSARDDGLPDNHDTPTGQPVSSLPDTGVLGTTSELPEEETIYDPGGSAEVVDLDRGFPEFWDVYPTRNGRKVGKAKALAKWRRMPIEDRRAAYHAAARYAQDCARTGTLVRDAERFLGNDWWRDWLTKAGPSQEPSAKPTPLDGTVAASVARMEANTEAIRAEAEMEVSPMPAHLTRAGRSGG